MKTYLVTGGAGFIGSNFVLYMLKKYAGKIHIINVDCLTYAGNLENLKDVSKNPAYTFKKIDICDKKNINRIFDAYDIDYVVNFAAESHVDRSIKNPEIFIETNILGTQILLDAAKNKWAKTGDYLANKKFIQISTDEVYGSLGKEGYFTENTPINPHSPYSASKASADMLVKAYSDTYNLPINITRCSNNYGPYQFPEKLIPLVINNALSEKKIPVYGDGKNVRDWLYVMDHCKAIDMVLQHGTPGEIYNVGGNNEWTNIEIIKLIIDTVRERLKTRDQRSENELRTSNLEPNLINYELIKFVKDRLGHDRRYAIDASKIAKEIGWYPETKFEDGIVTTVRWYLENLNWLSKVTSGEYLNYYAEFYQNV